MSDGSEPRLPHVDFVVVGAMKCATTTLVRALSAHSGIHMPERETHFFDDAEAWAAVWRDGRFDAEKLRQGYGRYVDAPDGMTVGIKAPSYMASALSMERIRLFHPNARIVVMLRDPIARAQSHWNHLVRARDGGRLDASLVGSSLRAHLENDAAELAARPHADAEIRRTNILHRGIYGPQLRRAFRLFPSANVFVGTLDDLKADEPAFLTRICVFLGVDYADAMAEAASGETASRREHTEELSAADRAYLADFYAEPMSDVRELLGRALDGWGTA